MTEDLLQDLVLYKKSHEKAISTAARSLITLFREVDLSLSLSLSLCVCLYAYMYVFVHRQVYVCLCTYMYLFVHSHAFVCAHAYVDMIKLVGRLTISFTF